MHVSEPELVPFGCHIIGADRSCIHEEMVTAIRVVFLYYTVQSVGLPSASFVEMSRKFSALFSCENIGHCGSNETKNSEIRCQNKDLHFLKEKKIKLSESSRFWSTKKSEKVRNL